MRTYHVAVALGMVFDDGFKYMVLYRGGGGGGWGGTITPPPSIAIFFPLYHEHSGPHSVASSNQEYSAIPSKKFVLYKKPGPQR